MSVVGIISNLFHLSPQNIQDRFKQFQQDFQQLGQDLQTGNLNAAQSDLASLQKLRPASSDSSSGSSTSLAQTLQQLTSDVKSGDLKNAQQLYSDLVQKLQTHHPHQEHHLSGPQRAHDLILEPALPPGNPGAAQTAYTTLAQDIQQFARNGVLGASPSITDSVSLQA